MNLNQRHLRKWELCGDLRSFGQHSLPGIGVMSTQRCTLTIRMSLSRSFVILSCNYYGNDTTSSTPCVCTGLCLNRSCWCCCGSLVSLLNVYTLVCLSAACTTAQWRLYIYLATPSYTVNHVHASVLEERCRCGYSSVRTVVLTTHAVQRQAVQEIILTTYGTVLV